ncbi:uncharacterized protein ISCGN_015682 [Ixodes scapularis]
MDTEKLMKVGQELGLSGAALKQWMDEERVRERDQRTAEREATKEAEALARARLDADDHTRARLEAERAVLELQLRLQERRESAVEGIPNESGAGTPAGFVQGYRSPHKLIPVFNEKRDELDAYIQRFERVATCQEWPQDKWALSLSLCLTGEALSVVGRMAADAATNYTVLKQTLLQRFRYTEEGYRAKFREARPEEAETGRQFTGRLLGYFDHWQEMAKTERTYDALRDKIVSEQFLKRCHEKLTIFLRERGCQGLDKLAEAADHYLEAQGLVHLGRTNKDQEEIWTGEHLDENTKTSYGYMVELRQRLEDTCRIAQEQLRKAKIVQKKYYDKKTRVRQLAVGDKVLLLLPSENNKLILTWKGPFKVLERRNDIDYVIDLGTRSSLFHINMLKKYEERPVSNQPPQHASVAVQHEEVEEEDIPSVTLHKKETHQDVKVSNDLTASQQAQVSILLAAHKESFTDVPGKTCLVECKLKTTTDIPIRYGCVIHKRGGGSHAAA